MSEDYSETPGAPRRLLFVMAHPDDECFLSGGTIRLEANRGTWVGLALATGGQEGTVVNPELQGRIDPAQLPAIRQQELSCSARTLGIARTWDLGYRDSGMEGSESSRRPEAFVNQDEDNAVEHVVALMRRARPQVVVTFDEHGGYGHPDHIKINRVTRQAFERSGDGVWYPEAGDPWSPVKLYYVVVPEELIRRAREAFEQHAETFSVETGLPRDRPPLYPDEDVTTIVDISSTVLQKREALRCYRTQTPPDFFVVRASDDVAREGLNREYFVLIRSSVKTEVPEHDLFAGVPAP
ncbi:MAG TPA: PIG-L family deacetylase [Chloroflexota bacterium]